MTRGLKEMEVRLFRRKASKAKEENLGKEESGDIALSALGLSKASEGISIGGVSA